MGEFHFLRRCEGVLMCIQSLVCRVLCCCSSTHHEINTIIHFMH